MKRIRLYQNRLFAGIDQGLSGAIAFISDRGQRRPKLIIHDMPTIKVPTGRKSRKTGIMGTKRIFDFARIMSILADANPDYVIVEELQIAGKPGGYKQSAQSVATTFKNGGIILGMLFALNIPYEEVRAAKWQKEFFRGKTGDTKNLSYDVACKLFPESCRLFLGPKGGRKDGRTDAALLSLYARRNYYGSQ
jgi:hypothetical protein